MQTTMAKAITAGEVTFQNSKEIPFQRWYPYIEGYSISFVQKLIAQYCGNPQLVYEPFAGTGTTLFAADSMGCNTVYSEINPLLRLMIAAKLKVMETSCDDRKVLARQLLSIAESIVESAQRYELNVELKEHYQKTFGSSAYFPEKELETILRLRSYIDDARNYDCLLGDLLDIGVLSCLLPVSFLKKQGDVRFRTEAERKNMSCMADILPSKIREIAEDVGNPDIHISHKHTMITANAKCIGRIPRVDISDVITSPPYLNGTNYFRNTKLELWFMGELKGKGNLRSFRNEALTSGINDVIMKSSSTPMDYHSPLLDNTLEKLEVNAYDSRIPKMTECYFNEMFQLFSGLSRHLLPNANVLIDLGDSIFSNVHIKTDRILVEVLKCIGLECEERLVLRQRRSRGGGMLSQVLLVLKYHP